MACPFASVDIMESLMEVAWEVAAVLVLLVAPMSLPLLGWALAVWWENVSKPVRILTSREWEEEGDLDSDAEESARDESAVRFAGVRHSAYEADSMEAALPPGADSAVVSSRGYTAD